MTTGNSTSGTVSAIRHMPMSSMIGSVASGYRETIIRALDHKAFQPANVRVPSPAAAIEKGPAVRAGPR